MLVKSMWMRGMTLIELLMALAITAILSSAIIYVYTMTVSHAAHSVALSRLHGALNQAVDTIARDIRRAGFNGQAMMSSANPFQIEGHQGLYINPANNCILISYDKNADGKLPSMGAEDERYGFRLHDGVLQYRPTGQDFSCNAAHVQWDAMLDPKVFAVRAFVVDQQILQVPVIGATGTMIVLRRVHLVLSAHSLQYPDTVYTVERTVSVMNDEAIS